jgi:hypothetical protein
LLRLAFYCHLAALVLFALALAHVALLAALLPVSPGTTTRDAACAPPPATAPPTAASTGGTGVAMGIIAFCFGGHAHLQQLAIHTATEHEHAFERALDVGFGASAVFLAALAAAVRSAAAHPPTNPTLVSRPSS